MFLAAPREVENESSCITEGALKRLNRLVTSSQFENDLEVRARLSWLKGQSTGLVTNKKRKARDVFEPMAHLLRRGAFVLACTGRVEFAHFRPSKGNRAS